MLLSREFVFLYKHQFSFGSAEVEDSAKAYMLLPGGTLEVPLEAIVASSYVIFIH